MTVSIGHQLHIRFMFAILRRSQCGYPSQNLSIDARHQGTRVIFLCSSTHGLILSHSAITVSHLHSKSMRPAVVNSPVLHGVRVVCLSSVPKEDKYMFKFEMVTFYSFCSGPESALSASSAVERRSKSQNGPGLLSPRRATLPSSAHSEDLPDALRAARDAAQQPSFGSCQRR